MPHSRQFICRVVGVLLVWCNPGMAKSSKTQDPFFFGTDEVGPQDQKSYLRAYYQYGPPWKLRTKGERKGAQNPIRRALFDSARKNVRAWERAHVQ